MAEQRDMGTNPGTDPESSASPPRRPMKPVLTAATVLGAVLLVTPLVLASGGGSDAGARQDTAQGVSPGASNTPVMVGGPGFYTAQPSSAPPSTPAPATSSAAAPSSGASSRQGAASSSGTTASSRATGTVYPSNTIHNYADGLVLAVRGETATAGTAVITAPFDPKSSGGLLWNNDNATDGRFRRDSGLGNMLALNEDADTGNVQVWTYDANGWLSSELWWLGGTSRSGVYYIHNNQTNDCLTDNGGGRQVTITPCVTGDRAQWWVFG